MTLANPYLGTLDLQSLRIFKAVFDHSSVSKAAESLAMNQSSVSYALDKLRRAFDDQLFFRSGQGVLATQRAHELYDRVTQLLHLALDLDSSRAFVPEEANHTFTFYVSSYEGLVLLPELQAEIWRQAPQLNIQVKCLRQADLAHELQVSGGLALSTQVLNSAEIRVRSVMSDEYVLFYDAHHRQPPKSLEDYLKAPHAQVDHCGGGMSSIDKVLGKRGITRDVRLLLSEFYPLLAMLQGSDLVVTAPSRCADYLCPALSMAPCPVAMEPLSIHMMWHERFQKDPAHLWLRQLIENRYGLARH